MKMSDKKIQRVYNAISENIVNLRIQNSSGLSIEEMDEKLFKLQSKIWKDVVQALNLTNTN